MSGKYTRDTNYIKLELNMKRVYPVPVCVFNSKVCNTMILLLKVYHLLMTIETEYFTGTELQIRLVNYGIYKRFIFVDS